VWSGALGGNSPPECGLPKLRPSWPVWPVLVLQLDVGIEAIPLLFPAPDSTAVDTAAIGNGWHWQFVPDKQLLAQGSRLGQVRVGRISHGRLLTVRFALYSVGRLPFLGCRGGEILRNDYT